LLFEQIFLLKLFVCYRISQVYTEFLLAGIKARNTKPIRSNNFIAFDGRKVRFAVIFQIGYAKISSKDNILDESTFKDTFQITLRNLILFLNIKLHQIIDHLRVNINGPHRAGIIIRNR
jgi:hypothetical protein